VGIQDSNADNGHMYCDATRWLFEADMRVSCVLDFRHPGYHSDGVQMFDDRGFNPPAPEPPLPVAPSPYLCSVPGCASLARFKGLCQPDYQRQYRARRLQRELQSV
jgi:hypothetical protein